MSDPFSRQGVGIAAENGKRQKNGGGLSHS